ncbi:AraC family transcriptional regulator [uncultured Bacteroides sp.]|uniref:helix-turn-helix domain-containing protein n=1 Tax=uncultured Bacteroides sp. TaxID=162156 RepID=UPI0025CF120E|nr:AraC family transcriptional regulator [uncultured Bacteroides sp.]
MTDIDMNSISENTLHIKNMVCNRCIMVVKDLLKSLGLQPTSVELGIAVLPDKVTDEVYQAVKEALEPFGFELIDDRKSQVVEHIKDTIIELVHYNDNELKVNLSDYLASKFNRDYSALSKLFSEVTNTTIEKYLIAQKIERAKELLIYGELSLNEIADKLNYSSAAYLSSQFKSVTGLTPSHFKKIKENKRKPLDEV